MEFESFVRLPVVPIAVGATLPVPPARADGTTAGTIACSSTSNCLIEWNGTTWVALTSSAYSASGLTTTSSNVTTTSS